MYCARNNEHSLEIRVVIVCDIGKDTVCCEIHPV